MASAVVARYGSSMHAFSCIAFNHSVTPLAGALSACIWWHGAKTSWNVFAAVSTTAAMVCRPCVAALMPLAPLKFASLQVRHMRCARYHAPRMQLTQPTISCAETLTSPPDILINCAGAGTWRFLHESSVNDLKLNLAAPFMAAMWVTRAFVPAMVARGSGCIVNVQSPAAYCAFGGATGYIAGRWALRGLSEATRADLHGTGVHVQVCAWCRMCCMGTVAYP